MKEMIAKRKNYTIEVDVARNRVYYAMMGLWGKPEDFPEYMQDWNQALKKMKPNFTVITDLRECSPLHPDIKPMLENAQKNVVQAGLRKTAEVFSKEAFASQYSKDRVMKMSQDHIAQSSKMVKNTFDNFAEAEAWLDEK